MHVDSHDPETNPFSCLVRHLGFSCGRGLRLLPPTATTCAPSLLLEAGIHIAEGHGANPRPNDLTKPRGTHNSPGCFCLCRNKPHSHLLRSPPQLSRPHPSGNRKKHAFPTAMKAARSFALGLQLLLAASAATSTFADTDEIPRVGIGSVHPICDPLQGECISNDEQVQDAILAGLQAEDKVVGTCPE